MIPGRAGKRTPAMSLTDLVIHRDERDKEKPSDHVPVVGHFRD